MRYTNAKIKRDKDGNRYYRPTIVPNIPIKDSDIFVYPKYGDRFDTTVIDDILEAVNLSNS